MSVAELELHEATTTAGPIRPDGLVPLFIIRPGIGRGRGKHLYEADMLERETSAGRFKGWKMYVDHQSPEAKKKQAGLPRSIRDLAGVVKETWWDPSVPADERHGRGAVVGLAKVNRFMRSLIEDLPEAVGASISAHATSVRPVNRGGQQVWLVEGIRDRGSVDFVTEAGAGGKVVSLMESLQESLEHDQEVYDMLEGLSTEDLLQVVRDERPDLLEALLEAGDGDGPDDEGGDDDELEARVKKLLPKFKGNRKMATMAARREMKESHYEGGDVDAAEVLAEALESDEGQALVEAHVEPIVEALFRKLVAPRLGELIEAALEDERELMHAEANAMAERRLQLRDLRDAAQQKISESSLPEPFKDELREKYQLAEDGTPSDALDVLDDEPGTDAKSAAAKIAEAVDADLERKTEQYRAARPATRVVGQGSRGTAPAAKKTEGESGEVEESEQITAPRTAHLLREAGIDPTADLYEGIIGS